MSAGFAAYVFDGSNTAENELRKARAAEVLDLVWLDDVAVIEVTTPAGCRSTAFTHTEYGEGFGFQTGQSYNDLGFVVQGGVYASRHLQVFLRYDQSIPDGKPRNPTLDPFSGGTGANDFRTLTGGFSYYLIPGNTLGRLTVDLQYMFDAQTTSLVAPVFNSGVVESTGSQWSFRLQWVARL